MAYQKELFGVSSVGKDVVPDSSAECISVDEDESGLRSITDCVCVYLAAVGGCSSTDMNARVSDGRRGGHDWVRMGCKRSWSLEKRLATEAFSFDEMSLNNDGNR